MTQNLWGHSAIKTNMTTPDKKEIWARELDFEPHLEPWCVYKLSEGGVVRHRTVAIRIMQHFVSVDGTPENLEPLMQPDGQPVIVVQTNGMTVYVK